MRMIAILLALILFAPAVTRACDCCTSTPPDGVLSIHKTPCHGCCPQAEIQRETQNTFAEESSFAVLSNLLASDSNFIQISTAVSSAEKEDPMFVVFSPPPPSSFHTLPLVLRI